MKYLESLFISNYKNNNPMPLSKEEGMKKKCVKVSLVYENCDGHDLLPGMFNSLVVSGITTAYRINCYQYKDGEVLPAIGCDFFRISINKIGMKQGGHHGLVGPLKKRVMDYQDITHVHLYFDNGTDEYIGVPWEDKPGDEYSNSKQTVEMENGELSIVISESSLTS